jgi:hypothetical protein
VCVCARVRVRVCVSLHAHDTSPSVQSRPTRRHAASRHDAAPTPPPPRAPLTTNNSYYKLMLAMAKRGDPRAQKEYAAWLRKLSRARKAYQEAYGNEEVEQLAAYGYEVRCVCVCAVRVCAVHVCAVRVCAVHVCVLSLCVCCACTGEGGARVIRWQAGWCRRAPALTTPHTLYTTTHVTHVTHATHVTRIARHRAMWRRALTSGQRLTQRMPQV